MMEREFVCPKCDGIGSESSVECATCAHIWREVDASSGSPALSGTEIAKRIREYAGKLSSLNLEIPPATYTKVSLVTHAMRAFAGRLEAEPTSPTLAKRLAVGKKVRGR